MDIIFRKKKIRKTRTIFYEQKEIPKNKEIKSVMNNILIETPSINSLKEEDLIFKSKLYDAYDKNCPLCKKKKKSQWYIADPHWWIVEDIDPHGGELCILACYWQRGNISRFKPEVLNML